MNTGHEKRKNSFSFHNNPVQMNVQTIIFVKTF